MKALIAVITVLAASVAHAGIGQDGPAYLKSLSYNSMTCNGTVVVGLDPVKSLGSVQIDVKGKDTDAPSLVISIPSTNEQFTIGNGYQGRRGKQIDCRYYSIDQHQYYLCDLEDPSKPLHLSDVLKAQSLPQSMFRPGMVCGESLLHDCIQLDGCTVAQ